MTDTPKQSFSGSWC